MPLRYTLVAATLLLLSGPALAQTAGQARQDTPIQVQVSFNFFVPGPNGDSEEAHQSRDRARRSVYEMAARECDLLLKVLAKECRMTSVTSNVGGRQSGAQQLDGYNVNASMNFQIMPK
ncbi:MAG: hypothetical protein Q7T45_18855 [Bradyrhizobium sp.]|uniref:hypothetical protein n=1 Tax=Bradyrhizobium sp. TaxID=376 RepID=UPI002719CED4|nr:hypothetical protein [Bradyrhizobium sp.]MDO8399880.1 hypothetical protein [Bradyrhizobium sp.]